MVLAKTRENRLAFAAWLIFFRDHGRFPREPSDLATVGTASLAAQIGVSDSADGGLVLAERTAKRLRTEIRARYGFREATVTDADTLETSSSGGAKSSGSAISIPSSTTPASWHR